MGFLLKLIPGLSLPKLAIFGVLGLAIAGAVGYGWYRWNHAQAVIATLTQSNAKLTLDVATVAQDNATLSAANAVQKAQAALQARTLAALAASQTTQATLTGGALATIQAAPPAQQAATVPPLLWATIEGLK